MLTKAFMAYARVLQKYLAFNDTFTNAFESFLSAVDVFKSARLTYKTRYGLTDIFCKPVASANINVVETCLTNGNVTLWHVYSSSTSRCGHVNG